MTTKPQSHTSLDLLPPLPWGSARGRKSVLVSPQSPEGEWRGGLGRLSVRVGVFLLTLLILTACNSEMKRAKVILIDPVRHYYPVIQGEMMKVSFEFENVSDDPLFIDEVQTSCGCLLPSNDLPIIVLPHKSGFVHLTFNTIKNTGYVCHYVYCYGNFADSSYVELSFDTNVVPDADYIRDYEQLWHEQSDRAASGRDFVDGLTSQKGYYVDDISTPRDDRRQQVQDAIDELMP